MPQQVQELIDKIKTEGVQQAEKKAEEIKQSARREAERVVKEAKEHAHDMIQKASRECDKKRQSTQMALHQASRDMLLKLRKEIEGTLTRILHSDVREALTPHLIVDIIKDMAKHVKTDDEILVQLNAADMDKLKKGYVAKLKEAVKGPISFKTDDDISAGFRISFDGEKSCFDFTDESLAGYLSRFLNAEVSSLLKESISNS